MEPGHTYRPRVSRETRRLLTTGVIAVVALWLLARIRFEDRPVTPNPVPSVLSQLATAPKYDDLASEIAQLQARLQPWLLAFDVPSVIHDAGTPHTPPRIAALRLRDELAVTLLPSGANRKTWTDASVRARDPASGLAVVRVSSLVLPSPPTNPLIPWTPRRLQQPRYFVASEASAQAVTLRPTFVGSLDPVDDPFWSRALWAVPPGSALTPGSFLFTSNAELVGLVIAHGAATAIVPGETLLAEADRLLDLPPRPPGTVGVEVQSLSSSVASATGATNGVVVTWVDEDGASTGRLMVGDVIEAVDGVALASRQHWDVRMARLPAGETLTLQVRRRAGIHEVKLVATMVDVESPARTLGLTLRRITGRGTEIVRVDPASAADRAGLSAGDVITLFADVQAPTPSQIVRSFSSLRQGQRVIVALTRDGAHLVTTLEQ